jgi:N-acetylated-alpha-linked acidic dipeptidase
VREGWRPKRTIVYAAWDGEEPGLFGSVEWVEQHAAELRDKLVAYINTDATRRGLLRAAGSATLEAMFNEIIGSVDDPVQNVSLAKRARAAVLVHGDEKTRSKAERSAIVRLQALGSGSDFSGFIQHLGVAALDLGFEGESAGGSYHTGHDTYEFFARFIDPDFAYVRTLAKMTGRLTMRLADADTLPFAFGGFAESVEQYAHEVLELLADSREDARRHNTLLSQGDLQAAANPAEGLVAPTAKHAPPDLDFSEIDRRLKQLKSSAAAFNAAHQQLAAQDYRMRAADRRSLDKLLMQAEGRLLREEGLPGRPWFRHHIYAPGLYTGYGVKTLPGVRESIETQNWAEARIQIEKLAQILAGYAAHIDRAAELIDSNLEASQ